MVDVVVAGGNVVECALLSDAPIDGCVCADSAVLGGGECVCAPLTKAV